MKVVYPKFIVPVYAKSCKPGIGKSGFNLHGTHSNPVRTKNDDKAKTGIGTSGLSFL